MTDHITRLKEALEGVAPAGPWSRTGATVKIEESDKWARVTIQCRANKLINRKVAAYVAAANPVAIRELLERLEQAEKDAKRYRWLRTQSHDWGVCEWDNSSSEWVRDVRGATVIDAAIDAAIVRAAAAMSEGGP